MIKTKKTILFVLAFSLIGFNVPGTAQAVAPDASSVVQVMIWDKTESRYVSSGSGVTIDGWEILTNYHVAEQVIEQPKRYQAIICVSVQVDALADCSYTASPFGLLGNESGRYSQELDLAILTFTGDITSAGPRSFWQWTVTDLPKVTNIKISQYGTKLSVLNLKNGSYVQTLGYPGDHAGKLAYSNGNITGYVFNSTGDLLRVAISAHINHGSSGGGAFDSDGNFIGVTSYGLTDGDGNVLSGLIIPVTTVNWWLQNTQGYYISKNGGYTIMTPSQEEKWDQTIKQALCLLGNAEYCTSQTGNLPPASNPVNSSGQNAYSDVHPDGTVVLGSDGRTVYVVGKSSKRGFATPEEYNSNGFQFKDIVQATTADLALPNGPVMPFADGTLVLDTSDGRTVYIIGAGKKRGFTSAEVFTVLGYKFSQAVKGNLVSYPTGNVVNSASNSHPEGSLVKAGAAIYKIESGAKKLVPDMKIFNSWGWIIDRVVNTNASDMALPASGNMNYRDGTLLRRDNGGIYIMSNGVARFFGSMDAFNRLGYKISNLIGISDNETNVYGNQGAEVD